MLASEADLMVEVLRFDTCDSMSLVIASEEGVDSLD